MTHKVQTKDGQKIAFDELALFFNNNTIIYGWRVLESGMTMAQAMDALQDVGFSKHFAIAFLNQMKDKANLYWQSGRLVLPNG